MVLRQTGRGHRAVDGGGGTGSPAGDGSVKEIRQIKRGEAADDLDVFLNLTRGQCSCCRMRVMW